MTTAHLPVKVTSIIEMISIRLTFLMVMTWLNGSVLLSQMPSEKTGALLSVHEARQAVRAADTGTKALQIFDALMKSNRVEIIEVCWQGVYTANLLSKAVTKMPDSPMKDQLVSRYLRNPELWWPSGSEVVANMEIAKAGEVRFIIPLVQRYLPDTLADYSVISTREKRLKLADAFDAAAGIPIEREPDAKRVWPPKPGDKPGVPSVPTQQGGIASKPDPSVPVAAISKAGEPSPLPGGWALWGGIAAVLAAAAGWLWLRSKGKGAG
jgi:hypothetical protein